MQKFKKPDQSIKLRPVIRQFIDDTPKGYKDITFVAPSLDTLMVAYHLIRSDDEQSVRDSLVRMSFDFMAEGDRNWVRTHMLRHEHPLEPESYDAIKYCEECLELEREEGCEKCEQYGEIVGVFDHFLAVLYEWMDQIPTPGSQDSSPSSRTRQSGKPSMAGRLPKASTPASSA